MQPKLTAEERFWAKVNKRGPSECWEWQGFRNPDGYGSLRGKENKNIRAHRLSWQFANGEIPSRLQVLHSCDNPPCVNPGHLFVGDHATNMRDRSAKGRWKGNTHFKVSANQVAEIRQRAANGEPYSRIAKAYGISPNYTWEIATARKLRHL